MLNYARVTALTKDSKGYLNGVIFKNVETCTEHEVHAKVVINATGPFTDSLRQMDTPDARPMIAPSQGVHLVLDKSFLPGESAIMVPHTKDGRVMFALPYLGVTLVGTTDTPIAETLLEPRPLDEEIEFILETAGIYLDKAPSRGDILSVFTGVRPLVKMGEAESTAALSRDHTIHISNSGLLTIAGVRYRVGFDRPANSSAPDRIPGAGNLAEIATARECGKAWKAAFASAK